MAISNPTPKQVRNGADGGAPGTGATVAQPGPDFTARIASAKSSAEASQNARKNRPEGLGVPDTSRRPEPYGRYVGGGS
jgi:hypothetical protein